MALAANDAARQVPGTLSTRRPTNGAVCAWQTSLVNTIVRLPQTHLRGTLNSIRPPSGLFSRLLLQAVFSPHHEPCCIAIPSSGRIRHAPRRASIFHPGHESQRGTHPVSLPVHDKLAQLAEPRTSSPFRCACDHPSLGGPTDTSTGWRSCLFRPKPTWRDAIFRLLCRARATLAGASSVLDEVVFVLAGRFALVLAHMS